MSKRIPALATTGIGQCVGVTIFLGSGLRLIAGSELDSIRLRSRMTSKIEVPEEIRKKLKNTPEQRDVVGPLVAQLVSAGWRLGQIIFGKSEWHVPKSPSEATKREKKQSFAGFPVDIAVFDDTKNVGDYRHLGL